MKSIIKLKLSQKILREKGKIGSGYGELRQKKNNNNKELWGLTEKWRGGHSGFGFL